MRRAKQQLPEQECVDILNNAYRGFLSVIGDGGYPYTIPINFYHEDGKIYFHSAHRAALLELTIEHCTGKQIQEK